jgi:hypothetical protein
MSVPVTASGRPSADADGARAAGGAARSEITTDCDFGCCSWDSAVSPRLQAAGRMSAHIKSGNKFRVANSIPMRTPMAKKRHHFVTLGGELPLQSEYRYSQKMPTVQQNRIMSEPETAGYKDVSQKKRFYF